MYRSDQVTRRFSDLQDFAAMLERRGRLRRISRPVSLVHEVTEIHRRVLIAGGPALLFEKRSTPPAAYATFRFSPICSARSSG